MNKRKIFLSALPFEATEEHVQELLGTKKAKSITMCVDKERNKFLGRCVIEFEDEAKCEKAYKKAEASGLRVMDRPVRISYAIDRAEAYPSTGAAGASKKGASKNSNTWQLFMKFLPLEAFEKHIWQLFEDTPELKDRKPLKIKLCKDRDGYSKGIGFLDYETKEKAEYALEELNGIPFWDKHVEVTWAVSRE